MGRAGGLPVGALQNTRVCAFGAGEKYARRDVSRAGPKRHRGGQHTGWARAHPCSHQDTVAFDATHPR